MGAWELYVRARDVAWLQQAPAWLRVLLAVVIVATLSAGAYACFAPRRPSDEALRRALEAALTAGTPRPIDLLRERRLPSLPPARMPGGGRRIDPPRQFSELCRIESLAAEARRAPLVAQRGADGQGRAVLQLLADAGSERVELTFTWHWDNRCVQAGASRRCAADAVVSRVAAVAGSER